MSFGSYVAGVGGLALVLASLGLAAVRLRALLLAGWFGAPARLVEAVLGVSLLTVLLQLTGAAGLISAASVVAGSLLIGLGAEIAWRRLGPGEGGGETLPAPRVPPLQAILALGAAAFLVAHWATGLQDAWGQGMFTFDTLWYHGPFAARMAQEGSAWTLNYSDPEYLNWFYPQNSELLHAAGIALFNRDLASPLINFAWLGLALASAWCIGRPYGVAPLALLAVAVVLDTGPMIPRESGTMANDVAPVALLLAAVAILINHWAARQSDRGSAGDDGPPPWWPTLLVAGLAMGVALGTKLTIAGAVAALAVGGALLLAEPRRRGRAFWMVMAGVAITSGYWFIRNLVHAGSPLPWLGDIGPINLPGPDRLLEGRDPFAVSHYLFFPPDPHVWRTYFLEATKNLLGPVWFLIVGGAGVGALLALLRPRSPAVRLAGAIAIVAAIAYVFTPLTAAGPEGTPVAFSINFRYLIPALALGIALLPLEPKLAPERWRPLLLLGGLVALALTSQYSDSATIWDEPYAFLPAAVLIGVLVVGAPFALALLGRRSAALAGVAGAVLALALVAVGWERQGDYLSNRYAGSDGFRFQLDDAARWAKPTEDLRIAVAGTSGAYYQYGFYGDELSNHVQFVGRKEPHGGFQAIDKCAPWREALNAGNYDYLVTTPTLDLNEPEAAQISPERGWVAGSANAREILHAGRVAVFRLDGPLDPQRCGKDASR